MYRAVVSVPKLETKQLFGTSSVHFVLTFSFFVPQLALRFVSHCEYFQIFGRFGKTICCSDFPLKSPKMHHDDTENTLHLLLSSLPFLWSGQRYQLGLNPNKGRCFVVYSITTEQFPKYFNHTFTPSGNISTILLGAYSKWLDFAFYMQYMNASSIWYFALILCTYARTYPWPSTYLRMMDCTCSEKSVARTCKSIARAALHVQRRLHVQLEFGCTCKTPRQENNQKQLFNGRESR